MERTHSPRAFAPVHPGEVIRLDYLEPLGLSPSVLARALGVTQLRLVEIVRGTRATTPDTALRLAHYFGTSAEFWTNMQARYDVELGLQ